MARTLTVDLYQYLHVENGASTAEIADLLGKKKNTVIQSLRYRGVLRESLGRDIERKVADWLRARGNMVIPQRGDAPFDLLVNGERVDVKSSHMSGQRYAKYYFQIQDMSNRSAFKNVAYELDAFYLVFLDEDGIPVYRLKSADVTARYTITVANVHTTKYPLQLLGYLESRREGSVNMHE